MLEARSNSLLVSLSPPPTKHFVHFGNRRADGNPTFQNSYNITNKNNDFIIIIIILRGNAQMVLDGMLVVGLLMNYFMFNFIDFVRIQTVLRYIGIC